MSLSAFTFLCSHYHQPFSEFLPSSEGKICTHWAIEPQLPSPGSRQPQPNLFSFVLKYNIQENAHTTSTQTTTHTHTKTHHEEGCSCVNIKVHFFFSEQAAGALTVQICLLLTVAVFHPIMFRRLTGDELRASKPVTQSIIKRCVVMHHKTVFA